MKTAETVALEKAIRLATRKTGVFGCYEVTIGFCGRERVDYMTYDTKGIFRCYEIKVSKADFHSAAAKSFVGHYNYYVLTRELYNQVKEEMPPCMAFCQRQEPSGQPFVSLCLIRQERQCFRFPEFSDHTDNCRHTRHPYTDAA